MPLLKFRNFLAATRKPNMIQFGMYMQNASADLDVIESASSTPLGITGTQDGSNTDFTLSGSLGALYMNGARLAPNIDYLPITGGVRFRVAPKVTDIILAFSASV